ncbi:MAG: hypothetical protein NDJ90_10930 [Oligoflexia bacterium]|nr:hypothetical protein [Oligoflexia bacterium]
MDVSLFRGLKIKTSINGKLTELTYLAGGEGELWPFQSSQLTEGSRKLLPKWMNFVSQGFGPGGDFALLKADLDKTPCLPLGTSSAIGSEEMKVMSATIMPGYKSREERAGQTAFYSAGPDLTVTLGSLRPDLPSTPFHHAKLDANYGSSGSAVVGQDGSIKGVLTQALDVRKKPYNPEVGPEKDYTIATFIDVIAIRHLLTSKWGVSLPSCD